MVDAKDIISAISKQPVRFNLDRAISSASDELNLPPSIVTRLVNGARNVWVADIVERMSGVLTDYLNYPEEDIRELIRLIRADDSVMGHLGVRIATRYDILELAARAVFGPPRDASLNTKYLFDKAVECGVEMTPRDRALRNILMRNL